MIDYATKINALLAKAASTDSDAERETFTEAAERLMVKWGVDDAALTDAAAATARRGTVPIEQRRYRIEGRSAALLAELVAAPAAAGIGPVRSLISRGYPYWWAVGYVDDLARVELYVPAIIEQARDAWRVYLRSYYATDRARVAFFTSYGQVIRHRLSKMFAEEAGKTTGAELAIVDRHEQVWKFSGDIKQARSRRNLEHAAAQDGARAGYAAHLNAGTLTR